MLLLVVKATFRRFRSDALRRRTKEKCSKCAYKSAGHGEVDNVEGLLTVKVGDCLQILLLTFLLYVVLMHLTMPVLAWEKWQRIKLTSHTREVLLKAQSFPITK